MIKPGSVVECVFTIPVHKLPNDFKFITDMPVLKDNYTVKGITSCECCGEPQLILSEVKPSRYPKSGEVVGFPIDWFRELTVPLSIENEINEMLKPAVV
jgi:hypothetical protein